MVMSLSGNSHDPDPNPDLQPSGEDVHVHLVFIFVCCLRCLRCLRDRDSPRFFSRACPMLNRAQVCPCPECPNARLGSTWFDVFCKALKAL